MKGIVYQIKCNITGEVYIGSTLQLLEKRISQHKSMSNTTASKQIIDRGDYEVSVLEEIDVENRRELDKYEAGYIKNHNCINKKMSYLTNEEKEQKKREQTEKWNASDEKKKYMKEYMKKYQKQDHIKVYAKNYCHNYYASQPTVHCPCGGQWKSKGDMNKHFKTNKHQKYAENLENEDDSKELINDFDSPSDVDFELSSDESGPLSDK